MAAAAREAARGLMAGCGMAAHRAQDDAGRWHQAQVAPGPCTQVLTEVGRRRLAGRTVLGAGPLDAGGREPHQRRAPIHHQLPLPSLQLIQHAAAKAEAARKRLQHAERAPSWQQQAGVWQQRAGTHSVLHARRATGRERPPVEKLSLRASTAGSAPGAEEAKPSGSSRSRLRCLWCWIMAPGCVPPSSWLHNKLRAERGGSGWRVAANGVEMHR